MITKFKQRYSLAAKSDFIRSIATMATGTLVAQAIPLLLAPVVSRLFNPGDYAVMAGYSAVTLMFTIVATGMFDAALILDRDDVQALNTGALALLVTLAVTLVSVVLCVVFNAALAAFMGVHTLALWLYLIPLSVLLFGFSQTLIVWNNRQGRYKRLASNKVYLTLITTAVTLTLGFFDFHGAGLILSLVAGQAVSFVILFRQTLRNDAHLLGRVSWVGVKQSWRTHKDFPKYNMPQGFLDALKDSGTVWLISHYFGNQALGAFSFAKSIIMRPLQVIGTSVSQVFYQRSSKLYNETGNMYGLARRTFFSLLGVGLPFALLVFVFGEEIFSFFFGQAWAEAGKLSGLMVLWLLVSFVASPFGSIPLILKRQKTFFLWSLVYSLLPIGVILLAGFYERSMREAVLYFSLSSSLIMIFMLSWIRSITRRSQLTNTNNHEPIQLVTPVTEKNH